MTFNFDELPNRRGTDSAKWSRYDDDVLPMWVADMDFRSPEPIIEALRERVEHGLFGYGSLDDELRELVVERMGTLYNWEIQPDDVRVIPGLVTGFNLVARTFGSDGDGVLLPTPAYPPFIQAIEGAHRVQNAAPQVASANGQILHYEIDFDVLEAATTSQTRLLILCNPHNPVGRVYTRAELEQLAEFCIRHDLVICSDEAHCELLYDSAHTPIASLGPEVAARTVTLQAATKTFNLAALYCGYTIVQNRDLMDQMLAVSQRIVPHVNLMGYVGTVAAFRHGRPWLEALLPYLKANRDATVNFIKEHLPGVRTTVPEGTYLAWLDCRDLDLPTDPFTFFLETARVALNDGAEFGEAGEGFVRLNFGCPRPMLMEALERMRAAVDGLS